MQHPNLEQAIHCRVPNKPLAHSSLVQAATIFQAEMHKALAQAAAGEAIVANNNARPALHPRGAVQNENCIKNFFKKLLGCCIGRNQMHRLYG
ncbi:hypothetical protein FACS1894122_01490 [Alphaproteobacteria bacterium]|nr:hypothetical protein FACS1894122_01490 [Alphaproteobacteria bacterium]